MERGSDIAIRLSMKTGALRKMDALRVDCGPAYWDVATTCCHGWITLGSAMAFSDFEFACLAAGSFEGEDRPATIAAPRRTDVAVDSSLVLSYCNDIRFAKRKNPLL